jgi:hypothetical protein
MARGVLITDPWLLYPGGAIAQLGERLLCKQEVVGSIPSGSTSWDHRARSSGTIHSSLLVREMTIALAVRPLGRTGTRDFGPARCVRATQVPADI